MARILIIDDDPGVRQSLRSALDKRGYEIVTAATLSQAREYLPAGFELVFLDVMLPDGNGIDLLKDMLLADNRQLVVMISGHADIGTAVEATRLGAYDFIEKPFSLDRILLTIENALTRQKLRDENERLSGQLYGDLVGDSPVMRRLQADILRAAPRADRFLLLGENGTGKELAAHMIHRAGKYPHGPFVPVNCGALPSELVESELFGHAQGAFTGATKARKGKFAEAHLGSIFLDEISEMPLESQAKLLRVLEERTVTPVGSEKSTQVSLTVIAASNRNLEEAVAANEFRQDLYYRLAVVTLTLPSLRERKEDIGRLAEHFLKRLAAQSGEPVRQLTPSALQILESWDFPGNVRELKNLLERIHIYTEGTTIDADSVRQLLPIRKTGERKSLKEMVAKYEFECIQEALSQHGGNVSEAARELGIERSLVYKKLRKYETD